MTNTQPEPDLSEQISSLIKDPELIKKAADAAAESTANYIRKHPYQAIAITLGVGFAIGVFLTKRKQS
jgi:ElaB/YqjD/DUF883 family membrane-anchored ribosome-binding protein